jgi:lipoate-protein ligase A
MKEFREDLPYTRVVRRLRPSLSAKRDLETGAITVFNNGKYFNAYLPKDFSIERLRRDLYVVENKLQKSNMETRRSKIKNGKEKEKDEFFMDTVRFLEKESRYGTSVVISR